MSENFKKELEQLLNKHGFDATTGTPDFILADYLANTLYALAKMRNRLAKWLCEDDNPTELGKE